MFNASIDNKGGVFHFVKQSALVIEITLVGKVIDL